MKYYLALKTMSNDTYYSMSEPQKYYSKVNEPDTKDHIIPESVYVNVQHRQIQRDNRFVAARSWGRKRDREWSLLNTGFPFGVKKVFRA